MATLAQIDTRSEDNRNRIIILENLIQQIMTNTVTYPAGWLDINAVDENDVNIDKGGKYVYGSKVGINDDNFIMGWKVKAGVANPTSNDDFEKPFGYSQ